MYINLLTKIQNAQRAHKETVRAPFSKNDLAVAEVLASNKFLAGVEKKGRMPKRVIEMQLRYDNNEEGAINGVKLISRPSRRMYAGYHDLRPVRQGFGIGVISTPKGVMTFQEARKQKVGGQLLFEIW